MLARPPASFRPCYRPWEPRRGRFFLNFVFLFQYYFFVPLTLLMFFQLAWAPQSSCTPPARDLVSTVHRFQLQHLCAAHNSAGEASPSARAASFVGGAAARGAKFTLFYRF